MDKLKMIKAVVFILTFLLIFGTLIAITAVIKGFDQKTSKLEEKISLNEPLGSSIHSIIEKNNYLYILIKDGGIEDRIVVFDTQKNQPVSRINLGETNNE